MTDENRSEDEAKAKDEVSSTEETSKDEPRADAGGEAPEGGDAEESAGAGSQELANPEAIARRVAALGDEDPEERKARELEQKLAERRAAQRKGKKSKKGGLEVAASKKLSKIGERAQPRRDVAVAADADALIDRTAKLSEWAKQNQKAVQIVGALIAAALLGVAGFLYFDHKRETDASVLLAKAVADERARIGDTSEDDEGPELPTFKTFDERRDSALAKYREVQAKYPKSGAAILARLAEGSLLLDKHEADAAAQAFADVKASPLAAADDEVRGRALEGEGFAHELQAQANAADAPKHHDEALRAFKELENTDVRGFKELAMYHQARVLQNKGDKDKAKEMLLSLKERLSKPDEPSMPGVPPGPTYPYLREVAIDRLRTIDPTAAPKAPPLRRGAGGAPSEEELRRMIEEAQRRAKGQGGGH